MNNLFMTSPDSSAVTLSTLPLFRSFFQGGFACSTQINRERRVDQLRDTGHDSWARQDYERLQSLGIQTARDGVRWHRIETTPYHYDWSSVLPMVRAARDTKTQVIWDLCHYG